MKKISLLFLFVLFAACTSSSDEADSSEADLNRLFTNFSTDYSKRTVPLTAVLSGGPPKDGIPAIDNPVFISVEQAGTWIRDSEPVILYSSPSPARVYPIQILMWHEIVNDTVNGKSIIVTYCPLCTTGIGFAGEIDGKKLDFGTTGKLRYSNLIMYDRQSESWWQQATGEALAGKYAGKVLTQVPLQIVSWAQVKTYHPDAEVLSKQTGFSRPYGQNPYTGYDNPKGRPFLYQGPETDSTYSPLERVLIVSRGEETALFSFTELAERQVIQLELGGEKITVFWQSGTSSALDTAQIQQGRDIGTAHAFLAEVPGQPLTFQLRDHSIVDRETGTEWNVLGMGVEGPLAGKKLTPIISVQHFWFSADAFFDFHG